jgi:colanic acid/amylovoran biosynthesis protein
MNYWNLGDLGIIISMIFRLREEAPNVRLSVVSPYIEESARMRNLDLYGIECKEIDDYLTFEGGMSTLYKIVKILIGAVKLLKLWIHSRMNLPTAFFSKREREALRAYQDADLVIAGWGEKIVDTGKGFPVWAAYPILVAILLKKKIVVSSASIGPFNRSLIREFYKWILEKTDLILVREPFSLEQILRMGLNHPEVHLTADEAFLLPSFRSERSKRIIATLKREKTVVGISMLNWYFPSFRDPKKEKERYETAVGQMADKLVREKNLKIVLMAHNVHERVQNDCLPVCRIMEAIKRKDRCYILPLDLLPQEEKEILGCMSFLVGTRMHSNIFALCAGIPVLAISYSPKTAGIMSMLGLEKWVAPIEEVSRNPAVLYSKLEQLFDEKVRSEYLAQLQESIPKMREAARRNARLIVKLAMP